MSEVGWAVQKAVWSELDSKLSIPVYSVAPPDTAYPYVTIGDENSDEIDFFGATKTLRLLTLSVWSDQPSKDEVYTQINEIKNALHRQRLSLNNGRMVDMYVQSSQVTLDQDGRSFTGTLTLRIRTED